jgi:phosphonate transport system substrate-binding protein
VLRRIKWVVIALLLSTIPALADSTRPVLIGTTPVFLDDQANFLDQWRKYMGQRLGRPVAFVQRGSYRDITDLILAGKLDFAWVCGPPYIANRANMILAAVPVFNGKPLYQSYLIVPASDITTAGFRDLKNKVYAFSDPDSNSGWVAPQAEMRRLHLNPATLFKKSFFTWAHRKVVDAVATGVAQGGSIDGYVWETLNILHPELTAKTRIVWKSPEYGFPPIIARRSLAREDFRKMQELLVGMKDDPEGRALLKELNLDGFTPGSDRLFDGIERNMKIVAGG